MSKTQPNFHNWIYLPRQPVDVLHLLPSLVKGGDAYGYIHGIIPVRNYDLRRYNISVICK